MGSIVFISTTPTAKPMFLFYKLVYCLESSQLLVYQPSSVLFSITEYGFIDCGNYVTDVAYTLS